MPKLSTRVFKTSDDVVCLIMWVIFFVWCVLDTTFWTGGWSCNRSDCNRHSLSNSNNLGCTWMAAEGQVDWCRWQTLCYTCSVQAETMNWPLHKVCHSNSSGCVSLAHVANAVGDPLPECSSCRVKCIFCQTGFTKRQCMHEYGLGLIHVQFHPTI